MDFFDFFRSWFIRIFIIGGLIACYFLFQNYRKERADHYWAGECRKWVEPLVRQQGKTTSLLPDEAAFFKLLHFFQKATAAGVDLPKMVTGACEELELPSDASALVRESVEAGYDMAKKLQLFEDIGNMINLERGEPALVKVAGWQDEKAVAGQVVPAAFAPEAAGHLANLRLMPACVRDAQGDTVTLFIIDRARAMEGAHVITHASLDRVLAAGPAKK